MEGSPFPSNNLGNSEKLNNDRNNSSPGRASKNGKQHHNHNHIEPLASGQAVFRLLCHAYTAGGVIGKSGSIIKHLETITGSKIRFEEGLPNCQERVINIVGDSILERKISLGDDEEGNMVDVSKAQEALVRVFERVLEVKGRTPVNNENENDHNNSNGRNQNEFVGCRLLAPRSQIGSLMGKRGKIVDGIRKKSGAKVKILKKDQMPACAGPDEELIQIIGGTVAVKKALLAVSHLLQCRTNRAGTSGLVSLHVASDSVRPDSSPKDHPKNFSCLKSVAKNDSSDYSLPVDVERTLNLDEDSSQRKVVFRLLFSNDIAGGVLGKGAGIVKSLEKETGACIKFSAPVPGSEERVATISSLENPDPSCSPAQMAVVCVFKRCMEVGLDHGLIPSLSNWDSIDAQIVVASSQLDCLLDEYGRVALDIGIDLGVEIQLDGADNIPNSATGAKIVRITGDFGSVKSAIFKVTGRIRESFFSGTGQKMGVCRHNSHSAAISSSSPYRREADSLSQSSQASKLSRIARHRFVKQPSSSDIQVLQQEQANSKGSTPTPVDARARGLKTSPSARKPRSRSSKKEAKQTVEVVVPQKDFGSVYGENGNNLARLKEISGATVLVQDPSSGESSGKVIISGTPDRIQIAQSLLQAFISFQ